MVSRTTVATVPSGSHDLRPRPLAISPTPSTPLSSKRRRHRRTVSASAPERLATSSLATPSAVHNNALTWRTVRCGNDYERAKRSSAARSASDTGNGAAVITGMRPPYPARSSGPNLWLLIIPNVSSTRRCRREVATLQQGWGDRAAPPSALMSTHQSKRATARSPSVITIRPQLWDLLGNADQWLRSSLLGS